MVSTSPIPAGDQRCGGNAHHFSGTSFPRSLRFEAGENLYPQDERLRPQRVDLIPGGPGTLMPRKYLPEKNPNDY